MAHIVHEIVDEDGNNEEQQARRKELQAEMQVWLHDFDHSYVHDFAHSYDRFSHVGTKGQMTKKVYAKYCVQVVTQRPKAYAPRGANRHTCIVPIMASELGIHVQGRNWYVKNSQEEETQRLTECHDKSSKGSEH